MCAPVPAITYLFDRLLHQDHGIASLALISTPARSRRGLGCFCPVLDRFGRIRHLAAGTINRLHRQAEV